jgi:thioredoxin reductase (NADPH)
VTIIERNTTLKANRLLQDKVRMHPKMEILAGHAVKEFRPKPDGGGKLGSVLVEELGTGKRMELHPAGAFVFIGLEPNADLVNGVVELDPRGGHRDPPVPRREGERRLMSPSVHVLFAEPEERRWRWIRRVSSS